MTTTKTDTITFCPTCGNVLYTDAQGDFCVTCDSGRRKTKDAVPAT